MSARSYHTAMIMVMWWIASITAGAWLAHGLFNGGRALAEITTHKSINAPVDMIARWCRDTTFAGFHRLAILSIASMGALFFANRLQNPDHALRMDLRMLCDEKRAISTALLSFLACVFFTIAITTVFGGWNAWAWPPGWLSRLLLTFLSAVLIELTFRGVFWRVFSTVFPNNASGAVSSVCYVLTMLVLDPPGIRSWEPALSSERFPLVKAISSGFMDSMVFFKYMVPLSMLAISLWAARLKTKSLWLVIGTQMGFLFSSGISTSPNPPAMAALLSIMVFCGSPFARSARDS